jgi:lipopolysaccharide transport protein LptA
VRALILISIFYLFGFSPEALAQVSDSAAGDTTNPQHIHIIHADDIFFGQKEGGLVQRLIGNVALYQDSTFFYCDSAIVFQNTIWANGNVQILQGDSTSIFSDSLFYSGEEKTANLYGKVALLSDENELFTEELNYDLKNKMASYSAEAYLKKGSTMIRSNRGYYWLDEHMAMFADSIVVVDSNFVLKSDTLNFDTKDQIAIFQGPTAIEQGANSIYCEEGYYDLKKKKAEFSKHAVFIKDDQKGRADRLLYNDSLGVITMIGNAVIIENDQEVRGDSIVYFQDSAKGEIHGNAYFQDSVRRIEADVLIYNEDNESIKTIGEANISDGDVQLAADFLEYTEATGQGLAIGNVIWRDTTNDMAIYADVLNYNKKTEYVRALGDRPYLTIVMDNDTMYIAGDTLISDTYTLEGMDSSLPTLDTFRRIKIYNDVRIYKSDMQGLCDSLVYTEQDSAFKLLIEPLLWSDTSQFSGDTIKIFIKKKSIDYVHQIGESMIISSDDLTYYNQIQGKQIRSYFKEGGPDHTLVEGNAQSLYYAKDEEGGYIAANKSICSKIQINFKSKKIENILFLSQPKAEMLPMSTKGLRALRLEGFKWEFEKRPKSSQDAIK